MVFPKCNKGQPHQKVQPKMSKKQVFWLITFLCGIHTPEKITERNNYKTSPVISKQRANITSDSLFS